MSDRQILLDWSFALQWVISCAVGTAAFMILGMVEYYGEKAKRTPV